MNDKLGDTASPNDLRSFGRRRARKPSPRQARLLEELLPAVRIDLERPAPEALVDLFNRRVPATVSIVATIRESWLEIGFGGGEHLLWQARANPHVGIIGCEPFEDGVVKVLAGIADGALANVRVHPDDARLLLRWLPPTSITRAFILFPDPWPKQRHRKRRLFNAATLDALAQVMPPGARLRAATDIGDYAGQMLATVARHPAFEWTATCAADWRQRPSDWPPTRYEGKAIAAGRRCSYLEFARL